MRAVIMEHAPLNGVLNVRGLKKENHDGRNGRNDTRRDQRKRKGMNNDQKIRNSKC